MMRYNHGLCLLITNYTSCLLCYNLLWMSSIPNSLPCGRRYRLSLRSWTLGVQLLLWARLLWPESYRTDLDDKLKADVILGSDSIADEQIVLARGNVRKLMGKCPERIAKSVCLETKTIMQDNYVSRKSTTCCKVLLGLWISLSKVCLHLPAPDIT